MLWRWPLMWANPSNRTHIEVSFRAGGRWKVHVLIILKRAFAVIAQCFFVLEKDVCYLPISLRDVATGQSILQGCEVSSYWQLLQSQPRDCSRNSLCCEIRTCLVATRDVQAQSEYRSSFLLHAVCLFLMCFYLITESKACSTPRTEADFGQVSEYGKHMQKKKNTPEK